MNMKQGGGSDVDPPSAPYVPGRGGGFPCAGEGLGSGEGWCLGNRGAVGGGLGEDPRVTWHSGV